MADNIYNIPAGLSPVDIIAKKLMAETNSLNMADTLVLLPNRRACRELQDAFVRLNGMQPTILPRILPLGDPDEDELFFANDSLNVDILPAISSTQKILLLTRLIAARQKELTGENYSLAQIIYLAGELGQLLDTIENEELDFSSLSTLVSEEYAVHWQKILDFLKIIADFFPKILKENGMINSAKRRILLLKEQAKLWQNCPPHNRIVVAGTTGAFPAMRELIKAVYNMPLGIIFLNGLDRCLDEDSWLQIDESHPQYEIKQLIDSLSLKRENIPDIVSSPFYEKEKLISEIMRPAKTTDKWRNITPQTFSHNALTGIHLINCHEIHDEALTIASIMRHTLEKEGKTAALVTGNRSLARRVSLELKRWQIDVDDSAGYPLSQTPVGIFLRLIAQYAENDNDTINFLSLLKHPLTADGQQKSFFRTQVHTYEKIILRQGQQNQLIEDFIKERKKTLQDFCNICKQKQTSLKELLFLHIQTAEKLATDIENKGSDNLWHGDDGEAAANFFASLFEYADTLPQIPYNQYYNFISGIMSTITVRPKYGTHPRLKILGPIEARLNSFDTLIIGEVNEGCWPILPQAGAWMSRPMKQEFGFPQPERSIGINANDFSNLLAQKEVFLTRADRVDGTPMNKSRWWLRLETVLAAANINGASLNDSFYPQTAIWLDAPQIYKPISAPAPKPPLIARPRQLWAGAIENLMRDPYIIFAKYILKLEPLKEIDYQPGIIDLGIIVHSVLEKFNRQFPEKLPENAENILKEIGEKEFIKHNINSQTLTFWVPAFNKIIDWILNKEKTYRQNISHIYSEISGHYEFLAPAGKFTVSAKADRLDITKDGKINIIDYKTGSARSKKEVSVGYAPQLPIEGIIAQYGGFLEISPAEVNSLSYWRLGKEEICLDKNIKEILNRNLENIKRLISVFDNENKAYPTQPNPKYAPTYSDYEHLSRVKEWGVIENNDN